MSIGGQSDARSDRKVYRLTPEGFTKKKERLEFLRTIKRKEIADYIHEAKEAGDISESSAYEDAKNEQAKVEGEIIQLDRLLAVAEIMTPDMHDLVDGPPVRLVEPRPFLPRQRPIPRDRAPLSLREARLGELRPMPDDRHQRRGTLPRRVLPLSARPSAAVRPLGRGPSQVREGMVSAQAGVAVRAVPARDSEAPGPTRPPDRRRRQPLVGSGAKECRMMSN